MVALPVRHRRQGQQEPDARLVLDVRDRERPFQPDAGFGVPVAHEPVHGEGHRDAAHERRIAGRRSRSPRLPSGCRSPRPSPRPRAPPARPRDVGVGSLRELAVPIGVGLADLAARLVARPVAPRRTPGSSWQPQSRLVLGPSLQHVLVEEGPWSDVGVACATASAAARPAAAGEHGQAIEDGPLFVRQEVVAPRDRGAQGRLARVRVTPALQEVEPRGQPLEELFDREELQAWGGELEREGQPVEPIAHGLARRGRAGSRRRPRRALATKSSIASSASMAATANSRSGAICSRSRLVTRKVGPAAFERSSATSVAISGRRCSALSSTMRSRFPPSRRANVSTSGVSDSSATSKASAILDEHEVTVRERRERHPPDAVREGLGGFGRGLEREARLPGATGAGQGEERGRPPGGAVGERIHLVVAADERCGRHGQVRAIERPDRWEVSLAQLVDTLGRLQVLESMIAEIHQREPFGVDLLHRRQRHEDLSAAPGGRDPGGAVDVGAHVPLGRSHRGARCGSRPGPGWVRLQGAIAVSGRLERTARRAEREEEGVTLRVDLDPAVTSEGLPEHAAVLGEGVRIGALTQPVQQPRGPFDVREQERHGSGRQVGAHHRTVRPCLRDRYGYGSRGGRRTTRRPPRPHPLISPGPSSGRERAAGR